MGLMFGRQIYGKFYLTAEAQRMQMKNLFAFFATFSLRLRISFRRIHFHKKQGESVCGEGIRAYAEILTLVSWSERTK
jgi:hypothetical protein